MTYRLQAINTIAEKLPAEVKNLRAVSDRAVTFEVGAEVFDVQWPDKYVPTDEEIQACVDDLVTRSTGKAISRGADGPR